jgi:hypothetical protein
MMNAQMSAAEEILLITDKPPAQVRTRRHWRVAGMVGAAGTAVLVTLVTIPLVMNGIHQSWRQRCNDHLKRLGLAFHNYVVAHGHFPTPAITGHDNTPLLSWRVAILPHLGYQSLYERFHLDEPWDNPHNRGLLAEMPPVFACPGGPGHRAGLTGYRVVVGPDADAWTSNTVFQPTRGVDIREITDGTSNTVLALENDSLVPWTKPDEIPWAPGAPLPRLASPHPEGAHALFADGTVKFLKATIHPETLLAILTINGGEVTSSS